MKRRRGNRNSHGAAADNNDDDSTFTGPSTSRGTAKLARRAAPSKSSRSPEPAIAVVSGSGAVHHPAAQPAATTASISSHPRDPLDATARFLFSRGTIKADDSPSLSPPPAFEDGPETDTLPDDEDDEDVGPLDSQYRRRRRRKSPELPPDRLTRLPRELLQHIFSYIAAPAPVPVPAPGVVIAAAAGAGPAPLGAGPGPLPLPTGGGAGGANINPNNPAAAPEPRIDRNSLALVARTCRELLTHARLALYRDLHVETRVQAHALHRALHANAMSKDVRHVTANVVLMAKTSSQWNGQPHPSFTCSFLSSDPPGHGARMLTGGCTV